jgi:para-aminobenzoate synthetase component 1
MFGHFGYDLKNEIEDLCSQNQDNVGFPDLFFFIPEIIIELSNDEINIGLLSNDHDEIFNQIDATSISGNNDQSSQKINIKSRFDKKEYIETVEALRKHILRGDCYEINFCQEFFVENIWLKPLSVYDLLGSVSPNPFSSFYKISDKFVMCASPERYLKKTGNNIVSQPIKGTWEKNIVDLGEDNLNKEKLFNSAKDRSENVMVVDLVRNDLSKICKQGSVKVDELYGIYSFPNLHHMISSITGELKNDLPWTDAIKATFPMGSMTGAPKKRVMELIERYEKTKRGIFSGALGYVTPEKDFDFNVVIRSIFYNQTQKYLSFLVGSGITFYSESEKEYEECLLKVSSIKKVLTT